MTKDNKVVDFSMDFAVRIVKMYKYLTTEHKEYILSKQLLRSGTSIGANVREAIYAQSPSDFISKMSIAMKEVSETEYWLELLHRTNYLDEKQFNSIKDDCSQIAKIITSIIKTSKEKKNYRQSLIVNC
jgi:four helix bundle protein